MKKILLLIAIGFSGLVQAQTLLDGKIYAYYENTTHDPVQGDSLSFYFDYPNTQIISCTNYNRNNGVQTDITETFTYDYTDSKGRIHYKQLALMCPQRLFECKTNKGISAQVNPSYSCLSVGLQDEPVLLNKEYYTYHTMQGVKIENIGTYNGIAIGFKHVKIYNQ